MSSISKSDSRNNRLLLLVLTIISGFILLVVSIFGIITGVDDIFGSSLVNSEFPSATYSPIYLKPITWLYGATLVFTFSVVQLLKKRIAALPKPIHTILMVVAFSSFGVAIYEILFNFTLWGALMSQSAIAGDLDPDVLFNEFPNPESPFVMNLVFATKIYTLLGFVSGYVFYFLNSIRKDSDN